MAILKTQKQLTPEQKREASEEANQIESPKGGDEPPAAACSGRGLRCGGAEASSASAGTPHRGAPPPANGASRGSAGIPPWSGGGGGVVAGALRSWRMSVGRAAVRSLSRAVARGWWELCAVQLLSFSITSFFFFSWGVASPSFPVRSTDAKTSAMDFVRLGVSVGFLLLLLLFSFE
jgi:hypothetical protein